MPFQTKELPPEQVEAAGFAEFNRCPHLCVEVPDGTCTISARTSDGHLVTFCFLPTHGPMHASPAGCVDIQFHNSAAPRIKGVNQDTRPVQHIVGFTPGAINWDTRHMQRPTTLLTVLLHDSYYRK